MEKAVLLILSCVFSCIAWILVGCSGGGSGDGTSTSSIDCSNIITVTGSDGVTIDTAACVSSDADRERECQRCQIEFDGCEGDPDNGIEDSDCQENFELCLLANDCEIEGE